MTGLFSLKGTKAVSQCSSIRTTHTHAHVHVHGPHKTRPRAHLRGRPSYLPRQLRKGDPPRRGTFQSVPCLVTTGSYHCPTPWTFQINTATRPLRSRREGCNSSRKTYLNSRNRNSYLPNLGKGGLSNPKYNFISCAAGVKNGADYFSFSVINYSVVNVLLLPAQAFAVLNKFSKCISTFICQTLTYIFCQSFCIITF